MTDHHDSNHNDTNAGEEHPNTTPRAGHDGHDTDSNAGDDLDWAAFAAEHANDLQDVERSRNARRFEKHAQRKEKEALLSVDDLDAGTFTDDKVPLHQRGPRDHGGRSWLDTDDVMDEYGDDFVPPNPKIGRVNASKLVFWILLVAGGYHRIRVRTRPGDVPGLHIRSVRAGRRCRPHPPTQGAHRDAHRHVRRRRAGVTTVPVLIGRAPQ